MSFGVYAWNEHVTYSNHVDKPWVHDGSKWTIEVDVYNHPTNSVTFIDTIIATSI